MKRSIPWDAARQRQQQAPRRYRACGPVGDPANNAPVPWSVQRIREGFGAPCGVSSVARGEAPEAITVETVAGPLTIKIDPRVPPGTLREWVQGMQKARPPCVYCKRVHGRSEAQCYQAAGGSYDANGGEPGAGP